MRHLRLLAALFAVCLVGFAGAQPFTFQGSLRENGGPATAEYDFRFQLWSAASGGSQIGSDRLIDNLMVQNGLFSASLDFGNVWTGADRFLDVAVRPGASTGAYQTLTPRIGLARTPYSIFASNAPWVGLIGTPAGFADGIDNDTLYAAGAGLALAGTTFSVATGGIGASMLAASSVTSSKIADGSILTADLADNAVNDAKLSDSGVIAGAYGTATQVPRFTVNAQGRITGVTSLTISGVAPGGAAGGDLSGTYPNPTIAAGTVTTGKILDGTIATIDLADGAITTGKILDGTIATIDLADGAITTGKIFDGTIATIDLADGAITTGKILDGTIAAIDLADASVSDAKLTNTTVTAGTYGSATSVGRFTVNAQGRITAASSVAISGVAPGGTAGGDLSGTYPDPTVAGLQGRPIHTEVPDLGDILKWNGTSWRPQPDLQDAIWALSGGAAYYTGGNVGIGTNSPLYQLHVETSTEDRAIVALNSSAIAGAAGGYFLSSASTARGVMGRATATSTATYGGHFTSDSSGGIGAMGSANSSTGANKGLYGISYSSSGTGVHGLVQSTTGSTVGVYGEILSADGIAVSGLANSLTGAAIGGRFESISSAGSAVLGLATSTTGTTYGGRFLNSSSSGVGVFGHASSATGATNGGWFESASTSGRGLYSYASATSGTTYGAYAQSNSTSGRGIVGYAAAASGTTYGVYGQSDSTSGRGVLGYAAAASGTTYGVYGQSDSTSGRGVLAFSTATSGTTYGVYSDVRSPNGYAVYGTASAGWGVYGVAPGSGARGVFGWATGSSAFGVYSLGDMGASGTKSFQIDHPLMPETHFLNHFCAEGPEPQNIYNGNVTTDARGYATVQLPAYFEAINRDFRYQLTVIGTFAQAIVAEKIKDNRFVIRTDKPNIEVSWEVKAVRNDRWVQQRGFVTELEKQGDERGKYLIPELYGQPKEAGIHQQPGPERPIK